MRVQIAILLMVLNYISADCATDYATLENCITPCATKFHTACESSSSSCYSDFVTLFTVHSSCPIGSTCEQKMTNEMACV